MVGVHSRATSVTRIRLMNKIKIKIKTTQPRSVAINIVHRVNNPDWDEDNE